MCIRDRYEILRIATDNATVGLWYTWDFETNGMTVKTHEFQGGAGAFTEFETSGNGQNGTLDMWMDCHKPL